MYQCLKCKKEVQNSTMAGIVVGQSARTALSSLLRIDIPASADTRVVVKRVMDDGDFSAGLLSGLNIKCPSCNNHHWKALD